MYFSSIESIVVGYRYYRMGINTFAITNEDIGMFSYKVQMLQKLTTFSKQRQLKFVEEFTEVLIERPRMLYDIWFTEEYHFWMNGIQSSSSCRPLVWVF